MSRFLEDRFQPIVVRNFDGSRVEWTYQDDQGNYAGTFTVTRDTRLPADFASRYKNKLFWAVYSTCDDQLDVISDMTDVQLKVYKKNKQ